MKLLIKKTEFIELYNSGKIKLEKQENDILPNLKNVRKISFVVDESLTLIPDYSAFSSDCVDELIKNDIELGFF